MRTIFGIILAAAALLSVTAMTLLFVMPAAWVCAWIRSGGGPAKRAFYRAFRDLNPLNDLGSG